MTVYINGSPAADWRAATPQDCLLCLVPSTGEAGAADVPGLAEMALIERRESRGTRFESHEGYDYMSLWVPQVGNPAAPERRVQIWCAPGQTTFLYEPQPAMDRLLERLSADGKLAQNVRVGFFGLLTQDDAHALEDLEEGIAAFEDELTVQVPEDSVERISALRRRLLVLKRYYEALFDLLEDMEENTNCLLDKAQLHALRIQTNRADRLSRTVLNLRDYVTQVRESYQAQVDIQANKIMQFFTVVTTIFLPLTLIVGWYGMNLAMPEFSLPWMYPVVVAASAALVVGLIVYFKRKKWL
ncbi:magnesium transporter [Ruminococcaceae bacterium OttesenSCG-928-A11]|nr:magnesium transporter [Ruminococcaceae bacterium OttesenSCG-928-A11]